MKITIRGYEPIDIREDLEVQKKGKFTGKTSYLNKVVTRVKSRSYREHKLPAKLYCLESLAHRAKELGPWKSYGEPLAGIGLSARILSDNCKEVTLSDYDEDCVSVLEDNFLKAVIGQESIESIVALEPTFDPQDMIDMIFLDYNNFTFGKFEEFYVQLKVFFDLARQYVILNDCSPFYLRFGPSSYKVYSEKLRQNITNLNEYFTELRVWYKLAFGWNLVKVAYFEESSFLLFAHNDVPLEIKKIEGDLKGMVTVS